MLRRADRWFRAAGILTLALLVATLGLLAAGADAWRPVFALAHLAALIALVPLGVVLVVETLRREGSLGAVVRRHRTVAVILAVVVVTIVVSLLNFDDGIRWLRRVANLTTVALILVLVARYFVWSRRGA
jgi:hypothetical protein